MGTGGFIALGLDQPERGLALMQEAVDVKLEVGDRWGAGAMLGFGASVPLKKGDLTTARRLAERGLSLAREVGAREIIYITLNPLAAIALAEGDYEHASRLFAEGLTLSSELGEESSVAYCLEGLATIRTRRQLGARLKALGSRRGAPGGDRSHSLSPCLRPIAPPRSERRRAPDARQADLGASVGRGAGDDHRAGDRRGARRETRCTPRRQRCLM